MKNKKLEELNIPVQVQPSEEEQLAILDEMISDSKNNKESLRQLLSDLKREFGE
jgi:sulfopyruvate decarboxylase TPP-binding subunit